LISWVIHIMELLIPRYNNFISYMGACPYFYFW
jgi:hypothetical protein